MSCLRLPKNVLNVLLQMSQCLVCSFSFGFSFSFVGVWSGSGFCSPPGLVADLGVVSDGSCASRMIGMSGLGVARSSFCDGVG